MELGGSPQVEADRYLISFPTYEDYLNSFVTPIDLYYARSTFISGCIAQLGYRARGEVLTRAEFDVRAAAARQLDKPIRHQSRSSAGPIEELINIYKVTDQLVLALAQREIANRRSRVMTIIYMSVKKRSGEIVSAYIDFGHRLRNECWKAFFRKGKLLKPKTTDLSYYNWHTRFNQCSNSRNFKVRFDPVHGLIFHCVWDGKLVRVDPNRKSPGSSTTRTRLSSPNYITLVLYDHTLRRCY